MPVSEAFCGDNIAYMSQFPDKFFDLAIPDPPYGIGDTWSKSRSDTFYKKGKMKKYQNESIPDRKYFEELFRVSKNQIIWGGNYFTEFLPPTNSWIIWDKMHSENSFMSDAELAWTSFKKVMKIASFQWDGAKKCERVSKIHPHQKPVKLYRWTFKNYAAPGFKILDTHMGSQSSRIAAFEEGLDYYGCDSDEYYFAEGCDRYNEHISQLTIF